MGEIVIVKTVLQSHQLVLNVKVVLTSWNEKNWVCDCCGYGKDSYEQMAELQKIIGVKN